MPLTLNNDSWVAVEPRDEEQASLPLSQHDGHRGGGEEGDQLPGIVFCAIRDSLSAQNPIR